MLVRRWLPPRLDAHLQRDLDNLLESTVQRGAKEVILGYEFDPAGPPQGLVGRLIASCHVIGEAEIKLCWRSGAVFRGPPATAGGAGAGRPYVVEVRYNSTRRVLAIRVFGPLESEWLWAALRFMASVMVNVSYEWPGVLWAGWLQCPAHAHYRVHLATPTEATIGSPLLPEASLGCDCLRDKGTVLGQAVSRLGNVIDTRTGDAFQFLIEETASVELQPAVEARDTRPTEETGADTQPALEAEADTRLPADTQPALEAEADTQPPQEAAGTHPARAFILVRAQPVVAEAAGQRKCASCRNALRDCRPSLWVSVPLASAFTLFLTLVTVEGAPVNLWTVSAVVVFAVLLIVAGLAAFFCPTQTPAVPQGGGEQDV
ncbi:unnamed protein product [Laminaria digitata]